MSENAHRELTRQELSRSITRQIKSSRRKVTILFTDIEDSTTYWDTHGDVQGRLMVDLHNRLTFPVVKKFRGKVIKTIGDSIMASFKKPRNALLAAIGIQQILEQARQADPNFTLKIRIGIHTGHALVERDDVFGDVVNVAARVESEAAGDEILLSGDTEEAVRNYEFGLEEAGSFTPKGKSGELTLFRCAWRDFASLVDDIRPGSYLPVLAKQKLELLLYPLVGLLTLSFVYLHYLRYLAADREEIALVTLNPHLVLEEYPYAAGGFAVFVLAIIGFLIYRAKTTPHGMLRVLSGAFGCGAAFFIFLVPSMYLPFDVIPNSNEILYESNHLFVEVLVDGVAAFAEPDTDSRILRRIDKGNILLQADTARRKGIHWNRVFLDEDQYGWLMRIQPANLGIDDIRLTTADKFYFRMRDVYAFIAGFIGFLWGFFRFHISPT